MSLRDPPKKPEVPLSTFAFLFAEMIHYQQSQSSSIEDLELKLHKYGIDVGVRVLELVCLRDPRSVRKDKVPLISLQFIHSTLWKYLFGHVATGLVKPGESDSEFYLIENNPITNRFISSNSYSDVNCATFLAGIIQGSLTAMCIDSSVTVGWDDDLNQAVFVIKINNSK